MRILNLYAGIGGNRKLWKDVEVTAVELNPSIAKFYKDHFPWDRVLVEDAHEYLLNHYQEFDFIWSSINCPSHSRARFWVAKPNNKIKPVFPDMKLYEEILFLKHYFNGLWNVENVVSFYEPLITPSRIIGRHCFWSNFHIKPINIKEADINRGKISDWSKLHGFDISEYTFTNTRRDKILRNCVAPELGLHILNCALNKESVTQNTLFDVEPIN
jgi:DNA (cytosine-5)-methyltransferase 1